MDQFAIFRISSIGTEAFVAAEVEAPRTECTLKIAVSIPASASKSQIQRVTVDGVTGRCGFMYEINRLFGLFSIVVLQLDVAVKYCLKQSTGHSFLSSGKEATKAETGSSGLVVFVLTSVNVMPSGDSR